MFTVYFCTVQKKNPWLAVVCLQYTVSQERFYINLQKSYLKSFFLSVANNNTNLGFSKSKYTSSDWVVTVPARPHLHLHCIFLNLPAQKGTIKQPTKQMRFPYIRQPCNHISRVVSFPICYVLSKVEPESRSCIRRVTVQPGAGLPPLALHTEMYAPVETSHLVHLQTTLQVETL